MAIVMFAQSLTVYEIITHHEKYQNFDLENEGQGVEKRQLRHSSRNFQFHRGEFFSEF